MQIPSAQMKNALKALVQGQNAEGCVDRFGHVVIAGRRTSFEAATWLRLFTCGYVEAAGDLRLRLSKKGRRLLDKPGPSNAIGKENDENA